MHKTNDSKEIVKENERNEHKVSLKFDDKRPKKEIKNEEVKKLFEKYEKNIKKSKTLERKLSHHNNNYNASNMEKSKLIENLIKSDKDGKGIPTHGEKTNVTLTKENCILIENEDEYFKSAVFKSNGLQYNQLNPTNQLNQLNQKSQNKTTQKLHCSCLCHDKDNTLIVTSTSANLPTNTHPANLTSNKHSNLPINLNTLVESNNELFNEHIKCFVDKIKYLCETNFKIVNLLKQTYKWVESSFLKSTMTKSKKKNSSELIPKNKHRR